MEDVLNRVKSFWFTLMTPLRNLAEREGVAPNDRKLAYWVAALNGAQGLNHQPMKYDL
jgi:hypothetical protein